MGPSWWVALIVLLRERWSGRRDVHIRFLKCQIEILRSRLPGNRVVPTPAERNRLLRLGAELGHAVEHALAIVHIDERLRRSSYGARGWQSTNLRTTFTKIIRRAGLDPWPRPFHNLRASLETDLCEVYPIQTVVAWLGNTPKVALNHYLMVRDDDFARAVGSQNPTRNPTRQALANSPNPSQDEPQKCKNPRDCEGLSRDAIPCDTSDGYQIVNAKPRSSRLHLKTECMSVRSQKKWLGTELLNAA